MSDLFPICMYSMNVIFAQNNDYINHIREIEVQMDKNKSKPWKKIQLFSNKSYSF